MYSYTYPRMAVTADIVVFDDGMTHLLLIQRAHDPFRGCWAFPGGFWDENDIDIAATAQRELKEETGLDNISLREMCTGSHKGRDPRGDTLTVVFAACVDRTKVHPHGADDARVARWFSLDALPPLAFDHADLLAKVLNILH